MSEISAENRRDSHEQVLKFVPDRRRAVLEVLVKHPLGLTAEQVAAILGLEVYWVRPRLTELLQAGQLKVVGKVLSKTTGKKISVYAPIFVSADADVR